jgi:hypothetical protein
MLLLLLLKVCVSPVLPPGLKALPKLPLLRLLPVGEDMGDNELRRGDLGLFGGVAQPGSRLLLLLLLGP